MSDSNRGDRAQHKFFNGKWYSMTETYNLPWWDRFLSEAMDDHFEQENCAGVLKVEIAERGFQLTCNHCHRVFQSCRKTDD